MTEAAVSASLSIFCPGPTHDGNRLPTHHRPPLHLRGAGRPETPPPGRAAGRAVAPGARTLPEGRSPQLLGTKAGRRRDLSAVQAALPGTRPPGPSPGYLVLAAAPAALLAAQQLRDGQRGSVRLVRCGGQAHVGAGTAADVQKNRSGAEKPSADRTAELRAAAPQSARTAAVVRRGQTSRAAPPLPSLRLHGGRMRQCRPAAPRSPVPLARRGGRWWAVWRGPAKNNLEHPSSPQKLILASHGFGRLALWLEGAARALRHEWKANVPLPQHRQPKACPPSTCSDSFTFSERATNLYADPDTTRKKQVRFTFYILKSPSSFLIMPKQIWMGPECWNKYRTMTYIQYKISFGKLCAN